MTEDFPCCPVVKTLPSNAGGVSSIPGWGNKIMSCRAAKKKKTTLGLEIYWGKGAIVLQFVNYS